MTIERVGNMKIKRVGEVDERIGDFIHEEFTFYGEQNGVKLNFDEFCFVAVEEDGDSDGNGSGNGSGTGGVRGNGKILGAIRGRITYNEVHIGDLVVSRECRRSGLGSKLVRAVEEEYQRPGYDKITLTTYGFQAPEFYKKLGYRLEFVREDKDPKLNKYFLVKEITH